MHRKMLPLFFVFFVFAFTAFSQESEWYWNQPIAKIRLQIAIGTDSATTCR